MTKALPPLSGNCRVELAKGAAVGARAAGGAGSTSASSSVGGAAAGPEAVVSGVSGASRGRDGVFVWGAVVEGPVGSGTEGAEGQASSK